MSDNRLKPPLEKDIQKQCLEWLRLTGIEAYRINSGVMQSTYHGKRQYVRFNDTPGMADIIGILPGGRFLAVEVKRPGGKVKPHQQAFIDRVARQGGLAIVVYSLDDLIEQITALHPPKD